MFCVCKVLWVVWLSVGLIMLFWLLCRCRIGICLWCLFSVRLLKVGV